MCPCHFAPCDVSVYSNVLSRTEGALPSVTVSVVRTCPSIDDTTDDHHHANTLLLFRTELWLLWNLEIDVESTELPTLATVV